MGSLTALWADAGSVFPVYGGSSVQGHQVSSVTSRRGPLQVSI